MQVWHGLRASKTNRRKKSDNNLLARNRRFFSHTLKKHVKSKSEAKEDKEENKEELDNISHHHDLDEAPEVVHKLEPAEVDYGVKPTWEEYDRKMNE